MRSATFIGVVALLVVLIGGALGVYAYDESHADTIAEGVRVGGIDVGGLERDAARDKLEAELLGPLMAPVVVRAGGRKFTLTAEVAHVDADVETMAAEALQAGRDGNVLTRTARDLTGGTVDEEVEPDVRYSEEAVANLVRRVAREVDQDARDADVRFTATGIERERSRTGVRLRREDLRRRVEQALVQPGENQRIIRARLRRTAPRVTTKELGERYGTIVHVNRGGYRLKLYKHLRLVRTYPIAVGQVGLETPAGLYDVQNKAVDPAWNVPNSDWAGDLAGTTVPGGVPENPLKARWLGIYNGAGIHGTDARGSIGTNASHGCIRMLVEDVIDLYDRVPVGAPVYIS